MSRPGAGRAGRRPGGRRHRRRATADLMELKGLGKEIWQGIDAQQYVEELRREWERSP